MYGVSVGQTYKHFKGGIYKVLGIHKLEHHWEGYHGGSDVVVRYVRVMDASGKWDNSGQEFLRPLEDWEALVEWPHGERAPRFTHIVRASNFPAGPGAIKI